MSTAVVLGAGRVGGLIARDLATDATWTERLLGELSRRGVVSRRS